jgi:hypothetical protein
MKHVIVSLFVLLNVPFPSRADSDLAAGMIGGILGGDYCGCCNAWTPLREQLDHVMFARYADKGTAS